LQNKSSEDIAHEIRAIMDELNNGGQKYSIESNTDGTLRLLKMDAKMYAGQVTGFMLDVQMLEYLKEHRFVVLRD